jgi:hypothetical protein
MGGTIVVDTTGLADLALAASQAARAVDTETEALRRGGRDGGRATQQAKLEADYEAAYRRAVKLMNDLTGSFGAFGRALDHIAQGYVSADAMGMPTHGGDMRAVPSQ